MKFVLLLTLFFCIVRPANGQLQKIYISPKAALGENQSRFIDSLKFYPLETKKGQNYSKYSNIQITDKYFIVSNYFEKELVFYTKDGKIYKTISFKKMGDGASPSYDKNKNGFIFFFTNKNYSLSEKDTREIQDNFANPKNKKYFKKFFIDLDDSLLTIKKATPTAFDILDAYNLKDDLYAAYRIDVNKNYKDS